jgi:CheY-like chemotaxis protein
MITFEIAVQVVAADSITRLADKSQRVIGMAPNQPRYRILAVDDQQEGRQLLSRLLVPLGFDVREAANGQEAIAIWETWEPHLIWMDMRMPVMDGHEATRRIKATDKGKSTIIIALTNEEEREQILANGCDDFLRKPLREAVLFELIHRHLGTRFIYEAESAPVASVPIDAASLAALPPALKAQLTQALMELNVRAINAAIEAIHGHDAVLARALATLAKNFQYRPIIDLLANISGDIHGKANS